MNQFYKDIEAGLSEAVDFFQGAQKKGRVTKIILYPAPKFNASSIKKIRQQLDLSQQALADLVNIKVETVKKWESGENHPSGAASRMLQLLMHDGRKLIKQLQKAG